MHKKLILIFLLIPFFGSAQYKSIFGNNSTNWNYAIVLIDLTSSDSLWIAKDTIVNDTTWKKVIKNSSANFLGGLLFEDTSKGKVWYKSLGSTDTASSLCFDFSLSVGDVFNINNGWKNYSQTEKTVDSIYFKNSRKHIQFKGGLGWGSQILEKFTFIEGVGSNISPIYKDPSQKYIPTYLLCSEKDGALEYLNKFFYGNCWVNITNLKQEEPLYNSKVFPTAFKNYIYITSEASIRFTHISLYNSIGYLVTELSFQKQLNLGYLKPGIYYLTLKTKSGNRLTKKIVKL